MIFCTLFNQAYLPQGIALYRSLERTAKSGFLLYVLCMDSETADVLRRLDFDRMKIIPLHEIEDQVMKSLRSKRSIGEYCWTCTSPFLLHLMEKVDAGEVVTYVDADIAFFSDPSAILEEMGSGSVYIHEHDFAPRYAALAPVSGRFNVGVSCFRNDAQGRACLELWKSQCFEDCTMDLAAGKCGDQNYLDAWPDLYQSSLVIAGHPGIGLGPWNVEARGIEDVNGEILAKGRPAVFYHYHSFRLLRPGLAARGAWLSGWFEIPEPAVNAFYKFYARELWRAVDAIERSGLSMTFDRIPGRYSEMPHHQVLLSMGGIPLPAVWGPIFLDRVARGSSKSDRAA